MTPTEQDEELREKIAECFGMDKHEDWYDSYRYSDREKMFNYITADRKRVALEAKQAILDWHNKQMEEVLDRLENSPNGANSGIQAHVMINEAIRAERNKLNNSDGDVK